VEAVGRKKKENPLTTLPRQQSKIPARSVLEEIMQVTKENPLQR
jgi:hypothetical protein